MGQVFKFATSYIQDLESIKKLNLMLKDIIKKYIYQLKNLSRKKNNIKNEDKIWYVNIIEDAIVKINQF
jgi:hypothetical protein